MCSSPGLLPLPLPPAGLRDCLFDVDSDPWHLPLAYPPPVLLASLLALLTIAVSINNVETSSLRPAASLSP